MATEVRVIVHQNCTCPHCMPEKQRQAHPYGGPGIAFEVDGAIEISGSIVAGEPQRRDYVVVRRYETSSVSS